MKKISLLLILVLMSCCFILSGCNEEIVDHTIFLSSENQRYGVAEGAGTYKTNEEVTITAKPTTGNTFLLWLKDGIIVSYDNPYKFTANKQNEGKYIAVFNYEGLELISLSQFTFNEDDVRETIMKIENLKLYLDSKPYYQPKIMERTDIATTNANLQDSYDLDPQYVFKTTDTLYCKVELTYLLVNGDKETRIEKSTIKNFTIPENKTVLIELNPMITDGENATQIPTMTLVFNTPQKPMIEEE